MNCPCLSPGDFFAAKLAYETDPADLVAERHAGADVVIVDVRSEKAWKQAHISGAVHLPRLSLADRAAEVLPDRDANIVVYCWGPGCNGSTKAALQLAELGYTRVRELIGGLEYWTRQGFLVESSTGRRRRTPDPLTAPVELRHIAD